MKKIVLTVLLVVAALSFSGCMNAEPKATEQDKANIDKLAREGIGARPLSGDQPLKKAEDAEPAPP